MLSNQSNGTLTIVFNLKSIVHTIIRVINLFFFLDQDFQSTILKQQLKLYDQFDV